MTTATLGDNLGQCHKCPLRARECIGACACTVDGKDILDHAQTGECPHPDGPRFTEPGAATPTPVPRPAQRPAALDWPARGPELWRELHQRPRDTAGDDSQWLDAFAGRIPCGECRRHFLELQRTDPPDFSSPAAYFASTVNWHNQVNDRLGKPRMPLDEAKRFWGY